jgi:hypothetical protein
MDRMTDGKNIFQSMEKFLLDLVNICINRVYYFLLFLLINAGISKGSSPFSILVFEDGTSSVLISSSSSKE